MAKNQQNKKKKVLKKSVSFLAKPEQDDTFLEFSRDQFIVGKQLSVFPIVTDGGHQDQVGRTHTFFELFNSVYSKDGGGGRRGPGGLFSTSGFGGGYNQYAHQGKQYVS